MKKGPGKVSQQAVARFEETARRIGWSDDQGTPKMVKRDLDRVEKARAALLRRLAHLEQQLKACKADDQVGR